MNDTVVIGGECNLINQIDGMSQIGIPILNGGIVDPYDGEYEVTPLRDDQTLETKNKKLLDNLTVHGVPYFEVSNLAGITVNIGG